MHAPHIPRRGAERERGLAMVLVLFIVLIISGLSMGLLQEGLAARVTLSTHKDNFSALEVAEAGIVRAEMELRSGKDLDGGGVGAVAGSYGGGLYAVQVTPHPTLENRWTLDAVGEHGMSRRRLQVGVRRRSSSIYADALFSVEDLPVSSVTTDAYDSSLGSYASQAINSDGAGSYAGTGGGLGSNGNMVLSGTSVYVRGSAIPGPGHEVLTSGDPTVTGDMAPRTFDVEMPPPSEEEFRAAFENNDNRTGLRSLGQGNAVRYNSANFTLDIAGNSTATMEAGTYFFRSFSMKGGSTLDVKGPVNIYITGDLDVGAGANILANSAADVRLFVHPYNMPINSTTGNGLVKINGGSHITWALYAPGATFDIGGGNHFYGAAIGKHIEMQGNNAFHYDKALGQEEIGNVASLERLYWREIAPPRR